MSDVIIRSLDPTRDYPGVATMFNESNRAWPGGFTDGIPMTAESVREWIEGQRNLEIYVAEVDGQIAGYATFMEDTPWPSGYSGVGYLDLLNVHPDHQGHSIGRKLLTATIERSVQEGWARQTLGTWPANFKAVPAYKRTGHYWRPGTWVWMENFIPGALQMPLAKPFFARHDWYTSYVRKVEQTPDDERWEGLQVYTERWEAEGESLTIWIDREALAPCAIETNDVQVAAIVQELEPLQGSTVAIRWRIHNKRTAPLRVHIHALGADGIEIDHREGFVVHPGLTVEHVAQVKVTDKAPFAKPDGSAPAVRSIVTLDHDEVQLFSGMRARQPLSLGTEPEQITLVPGRSMTLGLALHSELDVPLAGTLYLTPSQGLTVSWREQPVTLDPKGYLRAPVDVQAGAPGVYSLHARLAPEGSQAQPLKADLTLFCVEVGGLLGHQADDTVRLESDTARMTIQARNGIIRVHHKTSDLELFRAQPYMGPPYYPSDFDKSHFRLSLEQQDGRAVVRMAAEPHFHPDTCMELTVAMAANGLVTIEQQLENRGAEPWSGRVVLDTGCRDHGSALAVTPLRAGIVQAPYSLYPKQGEDAPRQPEAYAEPWIAVQQRGLVAGVAWGTEVGQVLHGHELGLRSPLLTVAGGQRSPVMRYAFWGGSGDWRVARESLLRWAGISARTEESLHLQTRPVAQARLERPVLATCGDAVTTSLIADSVSMRKLDGEVVIEGEGLSTIRANVQGLCRGNELRQPLTLPAPKDIGRYRGSVRLELPYLAETSLFEVLRLGRGGEVAISQGDEQGHAVWALDNGLTRMVVAPTFGPSAISWLWQGQEMLASAFPTPGSLAWTYPWYGGIHLYLHRADEVDSCGVLVKEAISVEPVIAPDAQGVPWQGVRMTARPQQKLVRDLLVSLEYLTLGHSPIVKVNYRVQNLRSTRQQVRIAGVVPLRLGAAPEQLVLRGEQMRSVPTMWSSWHNGNTWGLLTEPQSGRSALAVCPQGRLTLADLGQAGRMFEVEGQTALDGGATYETTLYLALAESAEAAEAFRGLVTL